MGDEFVNCKLAARAKVLVSFRLCPPLPDTAVTRSHGQGALGVFVCWGHTKIRRLLFSPAPHSGRRGDGSEGLPLAKATGS